MKRFFNFIGSVKFAAAILISIILLSLLGSVVSENSFLKLKSSFFISLFFDPSSNGFHDFLERLGLMDIYSTPLFIALLFLFTASMTVCTIKLFPFAIKGYSVSDKNALAKEHDTSLKDGDFRMFFIGDGWKISEKDGVIMAERHNLGKFGVIMLHTGIFLVLLASFIGYIFGFKAYVPVFEGQSADTAVKSNGEIVPLGFTVKIDEFNVDFYDNSRKAKAFNSIGSIIENGEEKKTFNIDVNRPLKYDGIVFYQSNYGEELNPNIKFDMETVTNGEKQSYRMEFDKGVKLGNDYLLKIADFNPTLAVSQDGDIIVQSEQLLNPAVLAEIYDKDGKGLIRGWIPMKNESGAFIEEINTTLFFKGIYGAKWTGLSVKKDPGTPVLYLGAIFMCFGVLFIYFLNYTAICFTADGNKIRYNIRQQRKYPLVKPADKFIRFLNKGN